MNQSTRDVSLIGVETVTLDQFQKLQYNHDVKYHGDILSLSVLDRMKHVLSHLVKYQYPLLTKPLSDPSAKKALIDAYIMLVSACNILKIRAADELSQNEFSSNEISFNNSYLAMLAKMAKACDSADHIENYPINESWISAVRCLLLLVIDIADQSKIDLIRDAKQRHIKAESKHGLYFLLEN